MKGNEDIKILKVFKFKEIYLLKTTSRYCENIRRNHNSNHIKLIIDKIHQKNVYGYNIYQKCFCKCDTIEGRYYKVPCKDFTGEKHMLQTNGGRRICEILYPNKKI